MYPVPKCSKNTPQRFQQHQLLMRHNLSLSSKMFPGSEQDSQNMEITSSLSFHGDAVPRRTRSPRDSWEQQFSLHLHTRPGEQVRCPVWAGSHRNTLKRGETARKSVTQLRRSSKCCTLAPINAQIQVRSTWRSLPALVTPRSDLGTNNQKEGMQWGRSEEINVFSTILIPNCH